MKKLVNGISSKLLGIGIVVAVLWIALGFISALVEDRQIVYTEAKMQISASAGDNFYFSGPYIVVPIVHSRYQDKYIDGKLQKEKTYETTYTILEASELKTKVNLKTEERTLGIFTAPTFTGTLSVDAQFDIDLKNTDDDVYLLSQAFVYTDISAMSLAGRPLFTLNGEEYKTDKVANSVQSSDSKKEMIPSNAVGTAFSLSNGKLNLTTEIPVRGATDFCVFPCGHDFSLAVNVDWASPGFTGFAYLPDTHSITDSGFTAEWHVPFAGGFARGEDKSQYVGFSYVQPVNVYQKLYRAVSYGILFIVVPFLVFFLFELFAKVQLHPVQYLLSGAACVLFFLLLLSFSEHLSFGISYAVSSGVVALLVSWYMGTVSGKKAAGWAMLPVFALLYSYLYVSLISEDYALLIGSLFAFFILAAVMICTRKVDWTSFGTATSKKPSAANITLDSVKLPDSQEKSSQE